MASPDADIPPNVSKAPSILVCNILLAGLSTICMAIRLYTRFFVIKNPKWDDFLAFVGYFFAVGLSVCACVGTNYGLGSHMHYVGRDELITFLKWDFAAQLFYITSFVASKLAFVVLYLTIFPAPIYRRINVALGILLVCEWIEEIAVVFGQCRPFKKIWVFDADGKCLNLVTFLYVSFGIKLFTDIVLFCMPIPMLKDLKIGTAKKVGVMIMFSLGLLVCVVSIVRVTFITNTSTDITWLLTDEMNWSTIEVFSLVICSCIPTFRAFLGLFPRLSRFLDLSTHTRSKVTATANARTNGNSYQLQSHDNHGRNKYDTFISSKHAINSSHRTIDADASSQEDILSDRLSNDNKTGITVTTNVRIEHDDKNDLKQTGTRTPRKVRDDKDEREFDTT